VTDFTALRATLSSAITNLARRKSRDAPPFVDFTRLRRLFSRLDATRAESSIIYEDFLLLAFLLALMLRGTRSSRVHSRKDRLSMRG